MRLAASDSLDKSGVPNLQLNSVKIYFGRFPAWFGAFSLKNRTHNYLICTIRFKG